LNHALPDALAERALQWTGVGGHLLPDGRDDLFGQFGQVRLNGGCRRGVQTESYA
jgi:hypothetical protein